MEMAISKPALLARREPAMPAHIGYETFKLCERKKRKDGEDKRSSC
jgi:hypothetical protein